MQPLVSEFVIHSPNIFEYLINASCHARGQGYRSEERLRSGISLAVQWLRQDASIAEGLGLIPGLGTEIPHASWHNHGKKKDIQVPTLMGLTVQWGDRDRQDK